MEMKPLYTLLFLLPFSGFSQSPKIDSLRNSLSEIEADSNKVKILLKLSSQLYGTSLDSSLLYSDEALQLSRDISYQKGVADSYRSICNVLISQGRADTTVSMLEETLKIYEILKDSIQIANTYNLLGTALEKTGEYKQGQEIYFKALDIATAVNAYVYQTDALNNLATFSMGQREVGKAIEYLDKSLKIAEENDLTMKIIRACINLSIGHDSLEIRKKYLDRAIELAEPLNLTRELSFAYVAKASILNSQEDYNGALKEYQKSIEIAQRTGDKIMEMRRMRMMGKTYYFAEEYDKAEKLYKEVLSSSYTDDFRTSSYMYTSELADVMYEQGKFKEAFDTLRSSYEVAKDVYSENLEDNAAEANIKYETLQKEEEITSQQLEIEKQRRSRNQILGGSLLLMLIGFGLGLWYYQRQSAKKKIAELALKNEILERKKLEELDDLKTQFFTNVSHELKTPLTLILGPLSNTIEKTTDRSSKESLLLAYNNAERLNDLINETLDLAKIEKGKMELNKEARPIARDLIRGFLSFSSLAEMRDIQLEGHINFSEDKFISCDIDKIEKILNNLVSNAIKFSPNGSKVMMNATMDDQLTVNITDYGRGIPIDEQPLIFNRFYQAKHNQYGSYGGTGIGLAFSKEISELLGGDLSVQSEEGKGSTFTLTLPVEYTDAPEITEEETWDKQSEEDSHYQPLLINGEKPKVLIVEDNKEMQGYLKSLLEETYHCDFAIDGYEAIKKVQSQRYHLISSDVMMPNMDGFTLKQRINSLPDYRKIPFIFLTARSLEEDKISGLQLGVDDYITKPFNKNEYQIRIYNLLQNHKERMMADQEFSKTEVTETVDNKILKDAETIILENIENPAFKVTDLADQLHYSQRQLARIIKQLTGLTPVNFILELRLQKAYTMIKSRTFRSVSEVRYSVGIESASYFTRKFKERFGVSPSEL